MAYRQFCSCVCLCLCDYPCARFRKARATSSKRRSSSTPFMDIHLGVMSLTSACMPPASQNAFFVSFEHNVCEIAADTFSSMLGDVEEFKSLISTGIPPLCTRIALERGCLSAKFACVFPKSQFFIPFDSPSFKRTLLNKYFSLSFREADWITD